MNQTARDALRYVLADRCWRASRWMPARVRRHTDRVEEDALARLAEQFTASPAPAMDPCRCGRSTGTYQYGSCRPRCVHCDGLAPLTTVGGTG